MLLTTLVVGETAPSTTLGTMIVVSGAFLILMLLLKKYAWGAIVDILTQREEKIANDLDSAEQSRVAALSSVKNEVADLSLQIAAKILNKELTPDAHEALIDSYIESLGKANETR